MNAIYDTISVGYAGLRKPDPRIAKIILQSLSDARSVINVGAGTGSYEPKDRDVVTLEPSLEMIRQRPPGSAKVQQGNAENIPFDDGAFSAAMAVLTVHHWSDFENGLKEMRRVAKDRVIILTFDPSGPYFWLADYIPEIISLDQPIMPKLQEYERILGKVEIESVPVPHDCRDGFLGAYWRRPQFYLDETVRSAISTFSKLGDISEPLARLESDIKTGTWSTRYQHLLTLDSLDIGYRLVVAELL